MRWCSVSHR